MTSARTARLAQAGYAWVHASNSARRHHDIEFGLMLRGAHSGLFAGQPYLHGAGEIGVAWHAYPLQVIDVEPDTRALSIRLPLPWFLGLRLPGSISSRLLAGQVVWVQSDISRDYAVQMTDWVDDIGSGDAARERTALLEIEVCLRRQAIMQDIAPEACSRVVLEQGTDLAASMAAYIAEHSAEPLTASQVAAAVHRQPNYAMRVFRTTMNMTIHQYLTRQRIACAQRLLITTDASLDAIAIDSGFRSLSQFYAMFSRECGQPPGAFRRATR